MTRVYLRPSQEFHNHQELRETLPTVQSIGPNQKSEAANRESILVILISRSRHKPLCLTRIRINQTPVMEDHNVSPKETGTFTQYY